MIYSIYSLIAGIFVFNIECQDALENPNERSFFVDFPLTPQVVVKISSVVYVSLPMVDILI